MSPTGLRRLAADKTQTTYIGIDAWAGTAAPWKRCVKPGNTRANGSKSRRWGALFPASLYGLVSWAKVNRRWDPSFEPVGIELPVAERESQACDMTFEFDDVAFGPRHRLTQQIAG